VRVEFRVLETAAQLAVLPPFERAIWGDDGDVVSVNMLVACIDEGGVAIGAFAEDHIVGAVFGFRTHEPRVMHSHYLAVAPDQRRNGLGEQLKREQATWCVARGVTAMRWTFDPLRLANAHLNLVKLGARATQYHVNHYGELGGINGSLPSDRLTVQWELVDPWPAVVETRTITVPAVTLEEIGASAAEAFAARLAVRAELVPLLDAGWQVVGIDRDTRTYTVGRGQ